MMGEEIPAPATGIETGFTAETSTTEYNALQVSWPNYNESAQRDVVGYRIYVADEFFDNVSGMFPHAEIPDENSTTTVSDVVCEQIHFVAVVAEDGLGNFDPAVYSESGKASVCLLGDVALIQQAVPEENSIRYDWDMGGVGNELANFVDSFRIYFDGAESPVVLGKDNNPAVG